MSIQSELHTFCEIVTNKQLHQKTLLENIHELVNKLDVDEITEKPDEFDFAFVINPSESTIHENNNKITQLLDKLEQRLNDIS